MAFSVSGFIFFFCLQWFSVFIFIESRRARAAVVYVAGYFFFEVATIGLLCCFLFIFPMQYEGQILSPSDLVSLVVPYVVSTCLSIYVSKKFPGCTSALYSRFVVLSAANLANERRANYYTQMGMNELNARSKDLK